MEVHRVASNSAAWLLREEKPEHALQIIDDTLTYMRPEDTYLLDTKVRILLNLSKQSQAFSIVKDVLHQDPSFYDFQDFRQNPTYLSWLKQQ